MPFHLVSLGNHSVAKQESQSFSFVKEVGVGLRDVDSQVSDSESSGGEQSAVFMPQVWPYDDSHTLLVLSLSSVKSTNNMCFWEVKLFIRAKWW